MSKHEKIDEQVEIEERNVSTKNCLFPLKSCGKKLLHLAIDDATGF